MKFFQRFQRTKSTEVLDTSEKIANVIAGILGGQSLSGVTVNRETAMRVATVFGCVRVLSESVGMLPCKVYERDGNKKEVANDHWLHSLFSVEPNGYMTPQEFWELLISCLCWEGNFYAYKTKVRGEVRELLPIHPNLVEAKLTSDWKPLYRVKFENGKQEEFTQDDIWHVRIFTTNGLNGLSPIGYARESIGLSLSAQEQGSRWFKDGVAPSGVLATDQKLTDEAFARLKKEMAENGGLKNSSKTLIMEMGLNWKPLSLSAQDLQFLETRNYQNDEICAIFRVPPHMVAKLENATFSNIEHQGISFVTNSLVPYLTRIEQRATVGLLSGSDRTRYYAKFNTSALLRGDTKARYKAYQIGVNSGFLSPNEVREKEDLNPREGGDIYLTPLNMTTNPEDDDSDEKDP